MSAFDEEKSAARVALNVLLRQVVLSSQRNCEHSDLFQSVVPVEQVTDYHQYVDPESATICVEAILSRTRSCFYTSVQAFRREYEQILANAHAYNGPGQGRHAFQPIIGWAQDLLDVCCEELHTLESELTTAEQRLKDALEPLPPSPRSSSGTCDDQLKSLEALVAACELAAEQEELEGVDAEHLPERCPIAAQQQQQSQQRRKRQTEPCPAAKAEAASEPHQHHPAVLRRASLPAGALQRAGSAPAKPHNSTAYDAAPKYRRHKSKVYIRPNKVVYLPTTFMEENFDQFTLPVNCEMIVETNGTVLPQRHTVTIKSVPRQGLSTMYCMTNVMKFQQQFLNWQILNWTKVDEQHIKIHLQGPNAKGCKGEPDEEAAAPPAGAKAGPESHKRKSNGHGHARAREQQAHHHHQQQQQQQEVQEEVQDVEEDSREDACGLRHHHPARVHRHARRSSPSHGCREAMASAQAPCLDEEQAASLALQQQLDELLAQQGRVSGGSGSGCSSPGHAEHLLHPGDEQEQQAGEPQQQSPATSAGASLPLPPPLDLMKLQQQLQYQAGGLYSTGHQMALPIWGLQGSSLLPHGAGSLQELQLLQGLDEQQQRTASAPHFTLNFPSASGSTKARTQQTALLLQQLGQGQGQPPLFQGLGSLPAGAMLSRLQGPLGPGSSSSGSSMAFKRYKAGADTDVSGMLAAMASGSCRQGERLSLQSLMMADAGALAAALAPGSGAAGCSDGAAAAAAGLAARSFDGVASPLQGGYPCSLQQAMSL